MIMTRSVTLPLPPSPKFPPRYAPEAGLHGWLVLDKSGGKGGMTSNDALNAIKKAFHKAGQKPPKIGHAGTLDPMASGVLPIAIGEATKTVSYIQNGHKSYDFTVQWGIATDSADAEGAVTETDGLVPSIADIEGALPNFSGEILQAPPVFSAIKVDGKRSYDLARKGEAAPLSQRPVHIHDLKIIKHDAANGTTTFSLDCGKGFYVRSLAVDLAASLHTYGHLIMLRRTRVGALIAENAICLDSFCASVLHGRCFEHILPLETVLDDISALAISEAEAQTLRFGQGFSMVADFRRWEAATKAIAATPDGLLLAREAWPSGHTASGKPFAKCIGFVEIRAAKVWPVRLFVSQ